MTVEADLFNLLKTLVSNRAFPDFAPVNTTRPYITYQQIGGQVVVFTEGAMADHDNGVFQTWVSTSAIASQFDAWINLLKEYETVDSFFDDPIIEDQCSK